MMNRRAAPPDHKIWASKLNFMKPKKYAKHVALTDSVCLLVTGEDKDGDGSTVTICRSFTGTLFDVLREISRRYSYDDFSDSTLDNMEDDNGYRLSVKRMLKTINDQNGNGAPFITVIDVGMMEIIVGVAER